MHFLHISLFLISLILGVDLDGIDINCISSRDEEENKQVQLHYITAAAAQT